MDMQWDESRVLAGETVWAVHTNKELIYHLQRMAFTIHNIFHKAIQNPGPFWLSSVIIKYHKEQRFDPILITVFNDTRRINNTVRKSAANLLGFVYILQFLH